MASETKQSYANFIATFLRSKDSEIHNLDIYHRMILRVIASYLDMPYGSCFAKQVNLAKECGMKERYFRVKSQELVDWGFLRRTKCRKLYHYDLSTDTGILCR